MFHLSVGQTAKYEAFREDQDRRVAEQQRLKNPGEPDWLFPDYGTIGKGYTFMFTPCSMGVMIQVRNNVTLEQIDLSDYDLF